MTSESKKTTQPADWWAAFRAEADNCGMTLSEWIGEAAKKQLPKDVRKSLSGRPAAHRPKETMKMIEKPQSARGKMPSDIDGDTPPAPVRCHSCRCTLSSSEQIEGECGECGRDLQR